MNSRFLGSSRIAVSEIGYGCMGLNWAYGSGVSAPDEKGAIDLIRRAIDIGVTFFDTADMYGPFTNEEIVGKALAPRRNDVRIATKCGIVVHGERTSYDFQRDGTPQHIREACDGSLKRLQTDVIARSEIHKHSVNFDAVPTAGPYNGISWEGPP